MIWWSLASLAAPEILGDPAFRAPDGIAAAAVTDAGGAWAISTRGEVTGFDASGAVVRTFQACPDRGVHLRIAIDPAGTRAGVDCGSVYRVFELPSGKPLFDVEAFTTDSAFSPDGRRVALLGERIVDGVSEAKSWLLEHDATTGAASTPHASDWEALWGVKGGWIGATTRERPEGPLYVEGRIDTGPVVLSWRWLAPEVLRTSGDWGPREAVAVLDGGNRVCVQYDFGGACLDGRTGGPRNFWSVPEAERTASRRAIPHPDGLAVGRALWFQRPDGVWRWDMDGTPERLPDALGIPISNAAGSPRFRVEAARLVPVDAVGAEIGAVSWGLPVSVDRAPGGRVVLADQQRRVFVVDGAEVRAVPGEADRVRITPDGSAIWLFADDAPTRVVPFGKGEEARSRSAVVAFTGGAALGIDAKGEVPLLVKLAADERIAAVSDALAVTGLQSVGDAVLVEYGEDDAWQLVRGGEVGPLGAHPFSPQTDLLLTDSGVIGVAEGESGWQVGRHTVPWSTIVRFLPDGSGFVTLADDATSFEIRDYPSGTLRETRELPGRWSDAWVRGDRLIVALRDGRLVVEAL
ncbi:MAG: hypothetical protein H6737_07465 [Alphaproteobacteria bacterium]|nr:hypothetical protein [Alphaproteobacteria bacterium]